MNSGTIQRLNLPDGKQIAYCRTEGKGPGILFLGGFKSDMSGIKATTFEQWCRKHQRAFVRFDYSGHGQSSGDFESGTIGEWLGDALTVLDQLTEGPQILIGSSMGGWISLLATLARPNRVHALITLACATDFTQRLLMPMFTESQRQQLQQGGRVLIPCDYDDQQPYPITQQLLEEGRNHLLLDNTIPIRCPVRLFHGMKDPDVPWDFSRRTCEQLESKDATLTLIKQGDHRLSEPGDLQLILYSLSQLSYIAD
ncbi:alpha/beta fold hydrolase [Sedimenticola sp.]|uniref:alpha/beta fold hydrolase n=1 Tax=Sedimenticola sp. TaxID=1940285 RepID=UPI003D1296AB